MLKLRFVPRGSVLCSQRPAPRRCMAERLITTLSPGQLSEDDYLDLSGQAVVKVPITLSNPTIAKAQVLLNYKSMKTKVVHSGRPYRRGEKNTSSLFPDGTQGFLYYKSGPAHAPVAGEIRFRLAAGKSRDDFARGTDLQTQGSRHQQIPWSVPLCNVVSSRRYQDLRRLLLQEGHGPPEFLAGKDLQNSRQKRGAVIMHSLDQELWVPFQSSTISLPAFHVAVGTSIVWVSPKFLTRRVPPPPDPTAGIWCRLEPVLNNKEDLKFLVRVTRVVGILAPELRTGDIVCRRDQVQAMISLPALEPLVPETLRRHFAHDGEPPVLDDKSTSKTPNRSRHDDTLTRPVIQHLRPDLLTPADHVYLSSLQSRPTMRLRALSQFGLVQLRFDPEEQVPVPPSTAGFFYADVPDGAHPVGGVLRFRVTSNSDPSTFAAGHDLCIPLGHAWSRPLLSLVFQAERRGNTLFGDLLVRQGIVPRAAIEYWRAGLRSADVHGSSCILTPTSATFLLNLALIGQYVHIGYGHKATKVHLPNPFRTIDYLGKIELGRYRRKIWSSYRGEILVRLEVHDDLRTVKMRVVKLLESVTQVVPVASVRGIDKPEEGDLLDIPNWVAKRIWNLWHPDSVEIPASS